MAETEFHLGEARPSQTEVGRLFNGSARCVQRRPQVGERLLIIGFGEPFGWGDRLTGWLRLLFHRGDDLAQVFGNGRGRTMTMAVRMAVAMTVTGAMAVAGAVPVRRFGRGERGLMRCSHRPIIARTEGAHCSARPI